ncbi:alpha/beta-hydrolase family protein [Tardiphaga sp. 42S5]|uniref:alpha/beta-hydrolase family protein n=1 Tax=Tardiphaga sp. 42S5 TaxID=1404799 RepID=UPI0039C9E1BA
MNVSRTNPSLSRSVSRRDTRRSLNDRRFISRSSIRHSPSANAVERRLPHRGRVFQACAEEPTAGPAALARCNRITRLPGFRYGSLVRLMNQDGYAAPLSAPNASWGQMRVVYLQYASDPVTFFEYRSLYCKPDWMTLPRGPDVSPQLRWYPVVTFLQLVADKFMATAAPIGHGHVYAPAHYIDAWIEVTDVRGWSPDEIARLKQHLSKP